MIYLTFNNKSTYGLRIDSKKTSVKSFIEFMDYLLLINEASKNTIYAKKDAIETQRVFDWSVDWNSLEIIEEFNSTIYNENNNANYIRCERSGSSDSSVS